MAMRSRTLWVISISNAKSGGGSRRKSMCCFPRYFLFRSGSTRRGQLRAPEDAAGVEAWLSPPP